MDRQRLKTVRRNRRRRGARKRIVGTPERPRMAIYRSLNHMYAQVIDDMAGRTICAVSTRESLEGVEGTGNCAAAAAAGKKLAEKAAAAGVKNVTFDRGGFRYHGRVKALADAARKEGLSF